MIQVQSISKGFTQGDRSIYVLQDMSFEVPQGETLAILGPSGSGKSTLLSLLALLDSPDRGDILFNQESTKPWSENERTNFRGKNIGIVFQQFHLVPYLTALENVTLPLVINSELKEKEINQRALELLDHVGLGQRAHHRPSQLSGGESQRVALARALIHKPHLLLADEPSGNLDQKTAKSVMDMFFDLIKKTNTTTILVTHDATLAERCDRRLQLTNGKLCLQS